VRVGRETKGRGGKAVTLVRGVPLDDPELAAFARKLKTMCGSGGTSKDGVIEVQGDPIKKVMQFMQAQGYTVKRTGG
jgi:translation initiation factor 1